MKLQKRRCGDQYSEHVSQMKRHAYAIIERNVRSDKVGGGRPRTATAGDDRYIILQAKRGRRQSASVIAQQFSTATGRQESRLTVERRLHKGGYSPAVLNAASRCKLTTDATVGSVPEAILNAF
ncbi:hypothetical protein TNCV_2751921 [Trichonephila clavipes]|nr:hypothetical protein TNCV_2751921 [Trichonephila clavipes]